MKKVIILSILISWSSLSQSSFTFPFISDARWEYNELNAFSAFPIGKVTFRLGTDTLMPNGKLYKSYSNFYFRNEGVKIFQFSNIDSTEFARYDFSKQKGDTVSIVRRGQFSSAIVLAEDRIANVLGQQRRVLSFHSSTGSVWDTIADSIGILTLNRDTDNSYELTGAIISGKTYGIITAVREPDNKNFPAELLLSANFPNPFNPSTTISFSLPSRSFVTLKIFDAMGREASTLLSEEMPAGNYSRQWNASRFPSGVYFYRMQAGAYTETKRLVLLR
jgi:hypothetical protein